VRHHGGWRRLEFQSEKPQRRVRVKTVEASILRSTRPVIGNTKGGGNQDRKTQGKMISRSPLMQEPMGQPHSQPYVNGPGNFGADFKEASVPQRGGNHHFEGDCGFPVKGTLVGKSPTTKKVKGKGGKGKNLEGNCAGKPPAM